MSRERGYWYLYLCMLLSGYWDVIRFVYSIRRPDEAGQKRFGLLAQVILEVGKLIGGVCTIAVLLVLIVLVGVVWPMLLWFLNLFFAAYIYRRLRKQEEDNKVNTDTLAEELSSQ